MDQLAEVIRGEAPQHSRFASSIESRTPMWYHPIPLIERHAQPLAHHQVLGVVWA